MMMENKFYRVLYECDSKPYTCYVVGFDLLVVVSDLIINRKAYFIEINEISLERFNRKL